MKELKIFLTLMTLIAFKITDAYALSCTNAVSKDLAAEAAHIKIIYETIDKSEEKEITVEGNKTTYKIPKYDFVFTIYNLTENLYISMSENVYNEKQDIYYSDTENGTFEFVNGDIGKIYNYTFTILSNNPGCKGQTVRTIRLTKPKYNAFSEFAYCNNSSNLYCHRFIEKELPIKSSDDFLKAISANTKGEIIEDTKKPIVEEPFDYTWINIAAITLGTVIIILVIFLIVKKAKAKKRWEV